MKNKIIIIAALMTFSIDAQAVTVAEAKDHIITTLTDINSLFETGITLQFHEEALPEGTGGFSAVGFESHDGRHGVIHVGIPNVQTHIDNFPKSFTLNSISFIIAHEASHVLLGHVTQESIRLLFPSLNAPHAQEILPMLGTRAEEDADTFAAKILAALKVSIDDVLVWNSDMGDTRDPKNRNPMIRFSFEEGAKAWALRNHMGPLCNNKISDYFEKNHTNALLTKNLREEFCDK